MLGGHGHIGGAHQGVGAGGVDLQIIGIVARQALLAFRGYLKTHLHAARFANPVALHGFDLLGPMLEFVEVGQQLFGIIGDFEVIHRDFALFNQRARAPAAPVDYLLVGEHGLIHRIPVYGAVFAVDNAFFKQAGKQPLLPAVILRRAGGDFALPINGKAQAFKLAAHIIDVFIRPFGRSDVVFHRRIFGRHTERIPTHGLHHIKAVQQFKAGKHIADGVVAHMPHMQLAAGIGKHGQAIIFGFACVFRYVKQTGVLPFFLGGRLNGRGLVVFLHGLALM